MKPQMNHQSEPTPETVIAAAMEARKLVARMLKMEVSPDTPVIYERQTILVKLGDDWWTIVRGEEDNDGGPAHSALTLLPFTSYYSRTNAMLQALIAMEGPEYAAKLLDIELVDDDETIGESSPTTFN